MAKTRGSGEEGESCPRKTKNPAERIYMRHTEKCQKVIIVPDGYGMALPRPNTRSSELADALEANGATVDYAIHPVARPYARAHECAACRS